MPVLKTFAKVFCGLVALIASVLLAAYVTGRTPRAYKTLLPADTLSVAGKIITAEQLAGQYEPEMYIRPSTSTPPLKWVWYEVTPTDSTLNLTYHFAWENEINPNKALHYIYSVFRAAYYGYPLYDVEYFELDVNRLNGEVQRIQFETGKDSNYYPVTVKHIVECINKNSDGNYYTGTKQLDVEFDNKRVKAGVLTWNHLSCLLNTNNISQYSVLNNAPMRFLTDADYMQYKFARKSQGNERTPENKSWLYFSSLMFFIITATPFYYFKKRKAAPNP